MFAPELDRVQGKYCKRLDLGFSDVIPTIVLQASEIHDIEAGRVKLSGA